MNIHDWVLFLITLNIIVAVFSFAGFTDTFAFQEDEQIIDSTHYHEAYKQQLESEEGTEEETVDPTLRGPITSAKAMISVIDQSVFALPALLDQAFNPVTPEGARTVTGYFTLLMRAVFGFMYLFFFVEFFRGVRLS